MRPSFCEDCGTYGQVNVIEGRECCPMCSQTRMQQWISGYDGQMSGSAFGDDAKVNHAKPMPKRKRTSGGIRVPAGRAYTGTLRIDDTTKPKPTPRPKPKKWWQI